ncbi:unnamed protein product, partial [Nesidiocoris tenuis]
MERVVLIFLICVASKSVKIKSLRFGNLRIKVWKYCVLSAHHWFYLIFECQFDSEFGYQYEFEDALQTRLQQPAIAMSFHRYDQSLEHIDLWGQLKTPYSPRHPVRRGEGSSNIHRTGHAVLRGTKHFELLPPRRIERD